MDPQRIAALIDQSPMNAGAIGSAWLADPRNIAIAIDDNVMLFELKDGGLCEFHWLAMNTRGRKAILDTRTAMRRIFDTTTARVIYGLIPHDRHDSALMARWIGASFRGEVETDNGRCQLFAIKSDSLEGKF